MQFFSHWLKKTTLLNLLVIDHSWRRITWWKLFNLPLMVPENPVKVSGSCYHPKRVTADIWWRLIASNENNWNLMRKIHIHAKLLSFVKESKTFICVRQVLKFWEGCWNGAMLSVRTNSMQPRSAMSPSVTVPFCWQWQTLPSSDKDESLYSIPLG